MPDELIKLLRRHRTLAAAVGIGAVVVGRCLAVDGDAKAHGPSVNPRAEYEMQVARVELVADGSIRGVERGVLRRERPIAVQGPIVELAWDAGVVVRGVSDRPTG